MKLTPERKARIDNMEYEEMLFHCETHSSSDEWLVGETGEYWRKRMDELLKQGADREQALKNINWEVI